MKTKEALQKIIKEKYSQLTEEELKLLKKVIAKLRKKKAQK